MLSSSSALAVCHPSWQTESPAITRFRTISITFNNSMYGVCHMGRSGVGLGRAYIDMFVKLRSECWGESSVYRSLANSTKNGGNKCLCVFQLVCGVFLLNLTKLGKHFYPQCRQQNFMDKQPLSQWRHINLQYSHGQLPRSLRFSIHLLTLYLFHPPILRGKLSRKNTLHFKFSIVQLRHTNYIKMWINKTFKIISVAPTCFGLYKPSSGSHKKYLAKITLMVQVYMLL
jgi:hypothetical protein